MNFSMITVSSIPSIEALQPLSPQRNEETLLRLAKQARLAELKRDTKQWLESLSKEELIEVAMKQWDKLHTV